MEWLALVVIVAVLGGAAWLSYRRSGPAAGPSAPTSGKTEGELPEPKILTPTQVMSWDGDGEFETQVEGESLYQDAILSIVGAKTEESQEFETRAVLSPEEFNGNRLYAVMIDGKKVGYLESAMTVVLNEMVARNNLGVVAFEVDAMITGGWKRAGSEGMFGVVLDLVDEDDD